jgi:hypothetical protein
MEHGGTAATSASVRRAYRAERIALTVVQNKIVESQFAVVCGANELGEFWISYAAVLYFGVLIRSSFGGVSNHTYIHTYIQIPSFRLYILAFANKVSGFLSCPFSHASAACNRELSV